MRFRPLILALLFLTTAAAGAAAEPVYPPGLRIGLEPAADLTTRPGVAGFEDTERKTTVGIAELPPGAYGQVVDAVFRTAPAGADKVTREMFSFQDGVGYLHEAHVVENGVASRRWLLLTMPLTVIPPFLGVVNVTVPDTASTVYSEAVVRKMLASIVIRNPPIEEQLGLIPFKLTELSGFKVLSVMPDSALISNGPDEDLSRSPYMVVSIGRLPAEQMEDRGRFARDLVANTSVRDLTLQSTEDMRIGGTPGFEIRGRGLSPAGTNVSMVQWVRFVGGVFIRMVAVAPTEQWNDVFNRFRAVRDGVELRK